MECIGFINGVLLLKQKKYKKLYQKVLNNILVLLTIRKEQGEEVEKEVKEVFKQQVLE